MITTRFYLDTRAVTANQEAPIKIAITKRSKTALLSTGIKVLPAQWDKSALRVVKHPNKGAFNDYIIKLKFKVDDIIRNLIITGAAVDMDATMIKQAVYLQVYDRGDTLNTFRELFSKQIESKSGSTRSTNASAMSMIEKFDAAALDKPIRYINRAWVDKLLAWMDGYYNANSKWANVAIVKQVFISAFRDRLIDVNPFEGIHSHHTPTRSRNLSCEQLRTLWNAEVLNERERIALDLFKFSFLTIAMNPADIAGLTPASLFNGRIYYTRAKTGKQYSIKVVDELLPLLDQYATDDALFSPLCNKVRLYANTYNAKMAVYNSTLGEISRRLHLPDITMYWARHSWATIANELGYPVDLVASALGHSHGVRITMVYIHEDAKKVDDANRRLIDYVLYEK